MDTPTQKMIQDAQVTSEIFNDAMDECFDYDVDPNIVFTTALQTILLTMFSAAQDKQLAIKAAHYCITAADILNEQQESTLH